MPVFATFVTLQNGSVAEWLGRGLQNLVQRFKSARNLSLKKTPFRRLFSFRTILRIHTNLPEINHHLSIFRSLAFKMTDAMASILFITNGRFSDSTHIKHL